MKDKVKSGLSRIWLLIRLTRITTIVYLLMVTVLFAYMFGVAFSGYSFKVMYCSGARNLFGVIAMLLGCVAGAVSVFRFGKSKKGDLLRLIPESSIATFVTVSLCEFIKAFAVSVTGFVSALIIIAVNGDTSGGDIRYFFVLLAEYVCYLILYFSVGAFFASISGRVITAVLGCASYYLGIGLICYAVMGLNPYLPIESSGFLSFICASVIYNAPIFTLFFYGMDGVGDILALPEHYISVFNGALSVFGMLFSAAVFYLIAVYVFRYRKVERLGEPYCFSFVAPVITSILTVECYFLVLISPLSGLDKALERVKIVFQGGKRFPGTKYAIVFFVAFIIFSALTNCSSRGAFKYLKLLPTLALATYIFQFAWLGGWV